MSAQPPVQAQPHWRSATVALVLGVGVAVTLGAVGRAFSDYRTLPGWGFSDNLTFKSWVTSLVLLLAVAQLVTALWMYGRLPLVARRPRWLAPTHRATGRSAFLLSLPVAFSCLFTYGFAPTPLTTRTLVHSVLGCLFYGVFAAKVLLVRTHGGGRWALPVLGGALVTVVVLLWMTGALWFFQTTGIHT